MSQKKVCLIKSLGTNMRNKLENEAYKISLGDSVIVEYTENHKKIELIFHLKKDLLHINKTINIDGMEPQKSTVYVNKENFITTFKGQIKNQEEDFLQKKEADLNESVA
jgi:hypothetical protein